jgi:hypothetical protein
MKRTVIALVGALFAAGSVPALAASSIEVPVSATAPSVDPRADDTAFDPAAVAQLSWNGAKSRAATEPTIARISTDGKYLYVRFDASQNERIVSSQPVDGKSAGDLVWVDLWPSGASGSLYRFAASPDGSSSATASNGAVVPAWQASGASYPGGYTVTMKIPLAGLRGARGAGSWNVQFARSIAATGERLVWSHDGTVASADDAAQAGTMTLPSAVGASQAGGAIHQ